MLGIQTDSRVQLVTEGKPTNSCLMHRSLPCVSCSLERDSYGQAFRLGAQNGGGGWRQEDRRIGSSTKESLPRSVELALQVSSVAIAFE